MVEARKPYLKLKKVCTQLAYPMRSDIWTEAVDDKGKQRGQQIFDPTASKALDIWGSGIMGNYAPKETGWFQQMFGDRKLMDSKPVRQWLQETDEHLHFTLNRSGTQGVGGYYEAKRMAITDSAGIGDSFMLIDEDIESGKLMCQTPHPREFTMRRDFFGRVIEVHREFKKTYDQIKDEFGEKALTDDQKLAVNENRGNLEVTVIQAIDRNPDYKPDELGARYMKWRVVYIQRDGNENTEPEGKVIRTGGYRTLNPIPWSLNRVSHECYGRGIVSQILIEILTANYISMDMLHVSQQAARPTMIVTSALKHRFSRMPGKTIFAGTEGLAGMKMGDLVSRLIDTTGYPFGIDMLERWQMMIDERFGIPLFLSLNMADQPAKTAYETSERKAERVVLMAPFLSTLGSVTDMELDRVFDIELNALDNMGIPRIPWPIPDEILRATDGRIDVQYIGPLYHLLTQYYATSNLLETIANMQAVISTPGLEDSISVVDGDELMRKVLKSGKAPEEIILEPDEVAEIRAIAAEQQEAQMMAELAAKAAQAAGGLGKKVEEGSILSEVA
jgi:hypothetical protein